VNSFANHLLIEETMTQTQANDSYASDRMFKQYLEAEWGDVVIPYEESPQSPGANLFNHGTRTLPFYREVASIIAKHTGPEARCIDVGGALGRLSFELSLVRSDLKLFHYDASPRFSGILDDIATNPDANPTSPYISAIDAAGRSGAGEPLRRAIHRTGLTVFKEKPTQQFNFVSCCNVFDRVNNQSEFMAWLFGLVSNYGKLLITTPYDYDHTSPKPRPEIADLIPRYFNLKWETNIDYIQRVSSRKIVQYKTHLLLFAADDG
jgi:Methyltransferase domain